jgi:hypothetical protein
VSESPNNTEERLAEILSKVVEHLDRIPAPGAKEKDKYDKFAAISPFLTGVLVAILGTAFTLVYQSKEAERNALLQKEQQTRQAKLDVVSKFMPYLTSKDQDTRKLALLVLQVLADTETAAQIALITGSEGTPVRVEDHLKSVPAKKAKAPPQSKK